MRLLLLLVVPTLFSVYTADDYVISDDYSVRFSTKKAEGTFSGMTGTVRFSSEDLTGSFFDVSVATASIETGNKTKDKHARGSAWLNAEDHPRIRFLSESFAATDTGYLVRGRLSINGITRDEAISFAFEDDVFNGIVSVARDDYDLDGPFLFGGLVGDVVEVEIRVPVERE